MVNSDVKWVSDVVGDAYKEWKNEFVVLDCGTGTGKTFFCIHILGKYAKKEKKRILYLCNRSKLRKNVDERIGQVDLQDTIDIITYQDLEHRLLNQVQLQKYDYIIADECHYFMTDAIFNTYTDVSFKYVIRQKKAVVLFISATAKNFFAQMLREKKVEETRIYRIEKDYSYVDKVYFYRPNELVNIINDFLEKEEDSKILVFCNASKRIIEMHSVYGEKANYYCSKHIQDHALKEICGWIDGKEPDCIKRYSDDLITFEKRVLFTTAVLDNGIDLKDERIKHIFTELIDVDVMLQSLGRKRVLSADDRCTFYIREYQKKGIQGFLNRIEKQLEPVNLLKMDYSAFYKKYGGGRMRSALSKNEILYYNFKEEKGVADVKINKCRHWKYRQDYEAFKYMKRLGHIEFLKQVLDQQLIDKCENIVINKKQIDSFLEYLKSIENKKLFKKEKELVRREFHTAVDTKLKGKCIGIHTLNGQLEDIYGECYPARFYNKDSNGKDYIDKRRVLEDGTKNPNRDKAFWVLENRKA